MFSLALVLLVLMWQIFGRAGRPQFDTLGCATLITTHSKLSHYLSRLTHQMPIESQFLNHLADNLNAEVVLGTVASVDDAVQWLGYTYLHVRMRKNPQVIVVLMGVGSCLGSC